MNWVKLYPIASPELRDLLRPYLGTRTDHFQHKLHNFARRPFDLTGYNRNVTNSARAAPHVKVVGSGSSSEAEETRRRMQESLGRFSGMLENDPSLGQAGVTSFPDRGRSQGRGEARRPGCQEQGHGLQEEDGPFLGDQE